MLSFRGRCSIGPNRHHEPRRAAVLRIAALPQELLRQGLPREDLQERGVQPVQAGGPAQQAHRPLPGGDERGPRAVHFDPLQRGPTPARRAQHHRREQVQHRHGHLQYLVIHYGGGVPEGGQDRPEILRRRDPGHHGRKECGREVL